MRPKTILAFEGLMIGTWLIGWLQIALTWNDQMLRMSAVTRNPAPILLAILGVMTVIMLTLTLLVSRRRSRVAAGVLIAFFALGIPGYIRTFQNGAAFGYTALAMIQVFGQLSAYGLLFLPASRAWFRRQADRRDDLRETFS